MVYVTDYLHLNFHSLVQFSSFAFLVVVVVVVALFVFGGLHFDLVFGLTHAFLAFFRLSLRRELNKNS